MSQRKLPKEEVTVDPIATRYEQDGRLPIIEFGTDGYWIVGWHFGWAKPDSEPTGVTQSIRDFMTFEDNKDSCCLQTDSSGRGVIICENRDTNRYRMSPIILTEPGRSDEGKLRGAELLFRMVAAKFANREGDYRLAKGDEYDHLWVIELCNRRLLVKFTDESDVALLDSVVSFSVNATMSRLDGALGRGKNNVVDFTHTLDHIGRP